MTNFTAAATGSKMIVYKTCLNDTVLKSIYYLSRRNCQFQAYDPNPNTWTAYSVNNTYDHVLLLL